MENRILIYSPALSPRLDYISNFIFSEILGLKVGIISSVEDFRQYAGPKLNYSPNEIDSSLKIVPAGLLSEEGIRKQIISISQWKSLPAFFITNHHAEVNFDIFSASFYMLSRYEEYLPYVPDAHGRYQGTSSLAFRNGFLEMPIVDQWANALGYLLENRFPGIAIKTGKFDWKSTIDVDTSWAYLNRSLIRTYLSLAGSFLLRKDFSKRIKVLMGKEKDPYDSFDFIKSFHSSEARKVLFFFLAGKPGGKDRNINPENKEWQMLVKDISSSFETGIHPSFASGKNSRLLSGEIRTLSSVLEKPVYISRQHYLLLDLPKTYRYLSAAGIADDYSMGFADHCGFRAGTSRTFNFYDLENETRTDLRIWPFALMDRTLKSYQKLDHEASGKKIFEIIDKVYKSGGQFISLFHNDTLGDQGEWSGWRNIYVDMIKHLRSKTDDPIP